MKASLPRTAKIVITLLTVFMASRLGGLFGFPPTGLSTFWPPNAILLAALFLLDRKDRWLCVVLSFPGYLLAELWSGYTLSDALLFSSTNCLEVALALCLITRFAKPGSIFSDLSQLITVFQALLASCLIVGLIAVSWLALSGAPFWPTFLTWMSATFIGYLVFSPVVLTLPDWRTWWNTTAISGKAEAAAAFAAVIILSGLAYGPLQLWQPNFYGAAFIPIPAMLWMALRFGPKGASAASLSVSLLALLFAINGHGPFTDLSPKENVASLQVFILSISVAMMLVAVLLQERNTALEELSELDRHRKEERYRALVDHAPDAIVILDVDSGLFIEANPRAARLYGASVEDLLRAQGPVQFSPEFQPDGRRSDEKAMAYVQDALDGEFPTFEWVHMNTQGDHIPCEISLSRFPDPERRLVRGSIVDVTEKKQAQKERSDLESRLAQAQKLEAVGQMTGGVAHDFNNLLNVILGNLELLSEEIEGGADNELIKAAISATYRGADLTGNMLSFARRAYLRPTVLDLSDLVRQADSWISRTIPASIRIETSFPDDLWPVLADTASTESALLNLVINARDAMPDGGVLTVEVANVTFDAPQTSGIGDQIDAGNYVMLAVSDTGAGIPRHDLDRVFEPFFTTKKAGDGTGLGLSMVHGFMKQSGGGVRIYSEVGCGTTVKLFFATTNKTRPAKPALEQQLPDTNSRVLIAEDQKEVMNVLVRILSDAGYDVVPASSGDQARQVFTESGPFDLLVTDIVMPGNLQGPELARELRKLAPPLPVVFMSGYAREASMHGNGLRKTDIRLMKPVSRSDLLQAVRKTLAEKPSAQT